LETTRTGAVCVLQINPGDYMEEKQELERELMLLESALRIFLVRDPVFSDRIMERIAEIEKDLKDGNYKISKDSGR
jgi:hypothetical protein